MTIRCFSRSRKSTTLAHAPYLPAPPLRTPTTAFASWGPNILQSLGDPMLSGRGTRIDGCGESEHTELLKAIRRGRVKAAVVPLMLTMISLEELLERLLEIVF